MKRIAFVGTVGAGKTTLFNALQGNYSLAKNRMLRFLNWQKFVINSSNVVNPI